MKHSAFLFKLMVVLMLVALTLAALPAGQISAAPLAAPIVNETFRNSTAPGWVLYDSACLTAGSTTGACAEAPNNEGNGNGWLRLTSDTSNQRASAIYNSAYSSAMGIQVTFQYASYGTLNGGSADGFTFYLIDGATASPTTGGDGAAMGYAFNALTGDPGVTKGYLAVGLDEYGSFGGQVVSDNGCFTDPPPQPGIKVLGSGNLAGSPANSARHAYDCLQYVNTGILTGDRAGARWVRITIAPNATSVKVETSPDQVTWTTRIAPFALPATQVALPATFKMGFSGGTGFWAAFHEIRNLSVTGAQTSTTSVACVPNPSTVGHSVTCTATVTGGSGTPTGTIDFYDGATLLQSGVALNGTAQATYTTSAFTQGSHTITANYGGNTVYDASSGNTTQVVNAAPKACSANLIQNPGAEAGSGTTNCGIVAVPNWTTTGTFTAPQYGFGAPTCDAGTPHGNNYFAGGPGGAVSTASQDISLGAYASSIDAGTATFDLSALLGGWQSQNDRAQVDITFLDAGNNPLGAATTIGPVTNADRGNVTGLLSRQATGTVPLNTRSVRVVQTMIRAAGTWNDGYADDLALSVCIPDEPPTVASQTLQSTYKGTGPSNFTVTFSEDVSVAGGATGTDSATNPANYRIINKGANGLVDTAACNLPLGGDDKEILPSSVTYIPNTSVVNLGSALPAGKYRLFVCGTTSIVDLAANALAGNGTTSGTDYTFDFVVGAATTSPVASADAVLPSTGFPMGYVTRLPAQPAAKAYASTDLVLEIPALEQKMIIVGVPQTEQTWDVSWLGGNAGWLEGSAFPTWNGNTVLTAHVWDALNQPGPFAKLRSLKYGDQVLIHAFGQTYTYEVRTSSLLWGARGVSSVFKHQDESYITLLTCETYNPLTGGYIFRRMVGAVLVSVK
jgi:LPXTG-site transpeptidase (sortase) family protein